MANKDWKWWAAGLFLPVLLLTAHVVRRRVNDLSPWKGGAFGMFSTLDAPWRRDVRVLVKVAGMGKRPLPVYVRPLEDLVDVVAVEPSHANLRRLAERILTGCIVERSGLHFYNRCPRGSTALRASEVDVEVWRPAYEPERSALRLEPVRSLTISGRGGAP